VAVLGVAGLASLFWSQIMGPAPPAGPGYVGQAAFRGDLNVHVSASGTIEPVRIIDVSTELSGTIRAVHVEANDVVTAGQVLAEIDAGTLRTQLARARASLDLAVARRKEVKAAFEQAERDLQRKQRLSERRATSERDLDIATAAAAKAQAALDIHAAELAVASADVALAEGNLAKARIVAPIDGVVLRRSVEPGQTIAAALQAPVLFRIAANLDEMQVKVDVDEADALSVEAGQAASFNAQALRDRPIVGAVRKIQVGPEIVQGVVSYKALIGFSNAGLDLRPGMTVTADIVVARRSDALLVANAAFRFSPPQTGSAATPGFGSLLGNLASPPATAQAAARPAHIGGGPQRRIYKLERGELRPVTVTPGRTDGSHTEILAGEISVGDMIVTDLHDVRR
jgi:HlyD family secretion protein